MGVLKDAKANELKQSPQMLSKTLSVPIVKEVIALERLAKRQSQIVSSL